MYGNEHNIRIMGNLVMLRVKRLGGTHVALLDLEDLPKLSRLQKPFISCNRNRAPYFLYAKDNNKRTCSIARVLTNCPDDMRVTYINGNSLDLRRRNLKVISIEEQRTMASHIRHYS